MLDGIDWVNDREWERAAFLRTGDASARKLFDLSYPHYRTDRVVEVIESEPAEEDPRTRKGFSDG